MIDQLFLIFFFHDHNQISGQCFDPFRNLTNSQMIHPNGGQNNVQQDGQSNVQQDGQSNVQQDGQSNVQQDGQSNAQRSAKSNFLNVWQKPPQFIPKQNANLQLVFEFSANDEEQMRDDLQSIRAQNDKYRNIILNYFNNDNHNDGLQQFDLISSEFVASKDNVYTFLQTFAHLFLVIKIGDRVRYLKEFLLRLKNMISAHIKNGELYSILSTCLPLIKFFIQYEILKVTPFIADQLIHLKSEDKFYLYDEVEQFRDIFWTLSEDEDELEHFKEKQEKVSEFWAQDNIFLIIERDDLESFQEYQRTLPSNSNLLPTQFLWYEYSIIDVNKHATMLEYVLFCDAISIFQAILNRNFISTFNLSLASPSSCISLQIMEFVSSLPEITFHHSAKVMTRIDFSLLDEMASAEMKEVFPKSRFKEFLSARNYFIFSPDQFLKLLNGNQQFVPVIFETESIPYIRFLFKHDILGKKTIEELIPLFVQSIKAGATFSFDILFNSFYSLLTVQHARILMHYACECAQLQIVKKLMAFPRISSPGSIIFCPSINSTYSPLHLVCEKGYFSILQFLLKHSSFDYNEQDDHGNTPLHLAINYRHSTLVKLLLQQPNLAYNVQNDDLETPLITALKRTYQLKPDFTIIHMLLQCQEIDVNAQTSYPDETPLILAVLCNFPEIVETLLKRPDINKNIQSDGFTPLDLAIRDGFDEIIQILVEDQKKNEENTDRISQDVIDECLKTRKKRQPYTPREVFVRSYRYLFASYKSEGIRYQCECGINYHKKERCPAEITLPYEIIKDCGNPESPFHYNSVAVEVKNAHTCGQRKGMNLVVSLDSRDLHAEIEKIYNSQTPRPSKNQIYVTLLKQFKTDRENDRSVPRIPYRTFTKIYNSIRRKSDPHNKEAVAKTKSGKRLELFNVSLRSQIENKTDRIICFASDFQLSLIKKARLICIDGTFSIAPPEFDQVWVIMARTAKLNVPIAYILLPDKKQSTYTSALTLLTSRIDKKAFQPGTTFTTDFEQAEINSVSQVLVKDGFYIQLCYFHYAQNMRRYFLQKPDDWIHKELKKIALMLPFISHDMVYFAINQLKSYNSTRAFANRFEEFYLKKYPIRYWNTTGKPEQSQVTNNIAESHNNKLGELFPVREHPGLDVFKAIISELEHQYALRYHNGEETEENDIPHYSEENDFDPAFKSFCLKLAKAPKELLPNAEGEEELQLPNRPHEPPQRLTYKNFPPEAQDYIQDQKRKFNEPHTNAEKREIVNETSTTLLNRFNIEFSEMQTRGWMNKRD